MICKAEKIKRIHLAKNYSAAVPIWKRRKKTIIKKD